MISRLIKNIFSDVHKTFFGLALANLVAVPLTSRPWKYFFTSVVLLFIGLIWLGFTKPKV